MAGPFEGLAAAILTTFGSPITVTPLEGPSRVIQGVFRDLANVVEDGQRRSHHLRLYTLQIRKSDAAGVVKGATVQPSSRPGETFLVTMAEPDGSPGNTLMLIGLEAQR